MLTAHTVGTKYAATRELDPKAVNKLIRADIAADVAAGQLPAGKYSVRTPHYGAIDITATVPGLVIARPDQQRGEPWMTDAARVVYNRLEAIASTYNFDNSDSRTDYFHARFYVHVRLEEVK